MKCPECVAEGERSQVDCLRGSTTLMAWRSYYDEDGNYHSDNPNKVTTQYKCTRGHLWSETR